MSNLIDRQAALDAIKKLEKPAPTAQHLSAIFDCEDTIKALPSAQPERDIPKKPNETTDRTWGIPKKQAVCPNCDAYLGMIHFISENGKTKVTYCESCGQAINWEGWDFDE